MSYNHLDDDTIPILELSMQEKLKWIRKEHFVYYEQAEKCLNKLNWIFEQTLFSDENEFISDMEGLSIIGGTGTGKTSIKNEFKRMHLPEHNPTHETYPVVSCLLKDSITGLKGLYTALLQPFNHPYAKSQTFKMEKVTIAQLEDVLIYTLRQTGTKLYLIDEFQHALGRNKQAILNQLKRTMLVSQVPFIPIGTTEVETILKLDKQLADRCPVRPYSKLDYLKYGLEFRKFIGGYEKKLPFSEPSKLSQKDRSLLIFNKIAFDDCKKKVHSNVANRRGIAKVLKLASYEALRNKHDCIHEEDIQNALI